MKGEIKRAGKRDGQTTTISKLFRKRCAVSLPSVEEAAVARNFSSVDASRMHGSLERNGSRRGVRLHVKTISFPTLRHFQVGSPNTDRRLFQSALASTGTPSPPSSYPRHPNNSSIRLDFCPTKIRERLASTREKANFHTELSAVLGIYRNLPLPKSVQDGGVDTSIDRIRFTLIHSPPSCSRMFKYVIRLVNIQLRSRCYSRSLRIV